MRLRLQHSFCLCRAISCRCLMPAPAVHHCSQTALVSGISAGYFQMNPPWLQYQAYGIKVTNNIIHDVWGAGLSVFGGYSILLAHNTLYK